MLNQKASFSSKNKLNFLPFSLTGESPISSEVLFYIITKAAKPPFSVGALHWPEYSFLLMPIQTPARVSVFASHTVCLLCTSLFCLHFGSVSQTTALQCVSHTLFSGFPINIFNPWHGNPRRMDEKELLLWYQHICWLIDSN